MGLSRELIERLNKHYVFESLGRNIVDRFDRIDWEWSSPCEPGARGKAGTVKKDDAVWLVTLAASSFEHIVQNGHRAMCHPTAEEEERRELAIAAAYKAFGLRRLIPFDHDGRKRMQEVLHNSYLAVCGGRRADLPKWYAENGRAIAVPRAPVAWLDRRLFYRNYGCWIRLLRSGEEKELRKVQRIVSGMVEDKDRYENEFMDKLEGWERRGKAYELEAYHHWSLATGRLAECLMNPGPKDAVDEMRKEFKAAAAATAMCRFKSLFYLLNELQVAAKIMVNDTIS